MEINYKPERKKKSRIGMVVLLIITMFVLVFGYMTYRFANDNKDIKLIISASNNEKNVKNFTIKNGWNTSNIADELKKDHLIKNTFLFKVYSRIQHYDGKYKAGSYIINLNINYDNLHGYDYLMEMMTTSPENEPGIKVTIPEGKTYKETENLLSASGLIYIKTFDQIADKQVFNYPFFKYIPERENKLEGYLFPNTYDFDPKGGEKAVIDRLLKQFDTVFKPEYYKRAAELNMTPDQIVILASIIEREAKASEERSIIAGVLYNRLHSKDRTLRRLQVDATIQYELLNRGGSVKERLTLEDLKMDTPYNTYLHEGLPPGPICSPGADSIKAALYPDNNNYIYYVAKDDGSGTHYFSETYKQHLAAKAKAKKNRAKLK